MIRTSSKEDDARNTKKDLKGDPRIDGEIM